MQLADCTADVIDDVQHMSADDAVKRVARQRVRLGQVGHKRGSRVTVVDVEDVELRDGFATVAAGRTEGSGIRGSDLARPRDGLRGTARDRAGGLAFRDPCPTARSAEQCRAP